MTFKRQLYLVWNWQLSSSPEQLWPYVADTNRLLKNLDLPPVQSADISQDVNEGSLQLSYNSIKHSDVWIEDPFVWEYPYRYGVKRTYQNGPYKEVKIQVNLFPNRKGTRLQYQLWAVPEHFFTAALSTLRQKTIERTRLKNIFKYYDDLIKRNHLPYEVEFKKSLTHGETSRFGDIREALIDATDLKNRVNRLADFVQQAVTRLKKIFKYHGQLVQLYWAWSSMSLADIRIKLAGDLKAIANRLVAFIRQTLPLTHLKKAISCYGELFTKYRRQFQARFSKGLTGIRKALAAGLTTMVKRPFIQIVVRLKMIVTYYDELVTAYHRLYRVRFNKSLARRGLIKLNKICRILAGGLKAVANRLAVSIRQALPTMRLKQAVSHHGELIVKYRRWYRVRFTKSLTGVRKALTAGLTTMADQPAAFIQQAAPLKRLTKAVNDEFSEQRNHLLHQAQLKKKLVRGGGKRLNDIKEILIDATGRINIVDRLVDFIHRADDIDLIRIEPYKLADYWQFDRQTVLAVFLHAAKEGLLNFNWDLYCPSCRTIQQTCKTLNEIHEPVFCSDCSEEFTINFNRSVQLSFRPDPLIRKISDNKYSFSGPQSKPHIAIQQYLKAGQKRYLRTDLVKGTYHLRTQGSNGHATVYVEESGQDNISIKLFSTGLNGEEVEICSKPNLIFENCTRKDQIFILERASWRHAGVTAAQVTSLQLFRDLFPNEVLRKGEKIAVDKLTLMFTDLFNSTGMYHKEGDNQAIGRVIEHFEVLQHAVAKENGALVKTIGDAIMAVFSDPEQAFRAFLTAQKIISQDTRFAKSLKLKAGIHHGNCMAVNLNNRIDYFGSTVNIASRLADLANENEIIISEDVSKNGGIHQMLADNLTACSIEQECATLKGFDTEKFNIERIRLETPILRQAI